MHGIDDARAEQAMLMFPVGGTLISASATPRAISRVRAVAGAFGAAVDLTVAQIADLHLLVDATCAVLLEQFGDIEGEDGRLSVSFRTNDHELLVDARRLPAREIGRPSAVSVLVLNALASRWSATMEGDGALVQSVFPLVP